MEILDPIYACRALTSGVLGYLAAGARFCRFRPFEQTFQSTHCARVTALLCSVNPLLQPEEVPCELTPGDGTPLVACTLRCRVIHALPHVLLAALLLQ
jgi:hypothetical protein